MRRKSTKKGKNISESELLREKQKEILKSQGPRLRQNSLLESHNEIKDGRYYHGILTFINMPLGKYIFKL